MINLTMKRTTETNDPADLMHFPNPKDFAGNVVQDIDFELIDSSETGYVDHGQDLTPVRRHRRASGVSEHRKSHLSLSGINHRKNGQHKNNNLLQGHSKHGRKPTNFQLYYIKNILDVEAAIHAKNIYMF